MQSDSLLIFQLLKLLTTLAFAIAIAGAAIWWFEFRRDVPDLVKELVSNDPEARLTAAKQLGNLGPRAQSAYFDLIKTLADSKPKVREAVLGALDKIGPPNDTGRLASCLLEDQVEVRLHVARTFATKIDSPPKEVLLSLERVLTGKNKTDTHDNEKDFVEFQKDLILALTKFRRIDPDIVVSAFLFLIDKKSTALPTSAKVNRLSAKSPSVHNEIKHAAMEGLAESALEIVRLKDNDVRRQGLETIQQQISKKHRTTCLSAFFEALGDADKELSELGRVGLKNAQLDVEKTTDFEVLKACANQKERNAQVLIFILGEIAKPDVGQRGFALDTICNALNDSESVVKEAIAGLTRVGLDGDKELMLIKTKLIIHKNPQVKKIAIQALSKVELLTAARKAQLSLA